MYFNSLVRSIPLRVQNENFEKSKWENQTENGKNRRVKYCVFPDTTLTTIINIINFIAV